MRTLLPFASWLSAGVWGTPEFATNGALVVHTDEPGYRAVLQFAAPAAAEVGTYVHVITDDAPAARATTAL